MVSPRDVLALNNLAYALAVRQHELDEALDIARRAAAVSNLPAVVDTLGWIHYLRGDHTAARPLLEQAAAAAPDNGEIQLHAAFLHAALGEMTRARRELDAALGLDASLAERAEVQDLQQRIGGRQLR